MARINVVMPVYNAGRFLGEAIDSILSQTAKDFSLIIVDDSSTDNSYNVALNFAAKDDRVSVHRGAARTRRSPACPANELFKYVDDGAVYVARMDADDIARSDRLEVAARYLDEHSDVSIVSSRGWLIDPHGRVIGLAGGTGRRQRGVIDYETTLRLLKSRMNPILQDAVMWRRGVPESVGGYNESLVYAEDLDLWLRCARAGHRWAILPEPLIYYRIHPTSLSRTGLHQELVAHQRVVRGAALDEPLPSTIEVAMQELDAPMRLRFIVSSLVRSGNSIIAARALGALAPIKVARMIQWLGQARFSQWFVKQGLARCWTGLHHIYWSRQYRIHSSANTH